jgi:hypothetical protein
MNDQHWQRVEIIFHACLLLSADRRASALDLHCAGDPGLRADVEAVLDASLHADGFIEDIVRGAADRLRDRGENPLP